MLENYIERIENMSKKELTKKLKKAGVKFIKKSKLKFNYERYQTTYYLGNCNVKKIPFSDKQSGQNNTMPTDFSYNNIRNNYSELGKNSQSEVAA